MEAAHVVRLRGHDVTIYEKSDIFGCNLIPTHTRDFKYEVGGSSPFTSSIRKDRHQKDPRGFGYAGLSFKT